MNDPEKKIYDDISRGVEFLIKTYSTEEDFLKILFQINVAAIEEIVETYPDCDPRHIAEILNGALYSVQWDSRQNKGVEF